MRRLLVEEREACQIILGKEQVRSQRIQAQQDAIHQLMTSGELWHEDLGMALAGITEMAVSAIGCSRASLWFFSSNRNELLCADLYESGKKAHSNEIIIKASNYPTYLDELRRAGTIAANDAAQDFRTEALNRDYLMPNGISSLVECTIVIAGKMVGIASLEEVGPKRFWYPDEINFCKTMADYGGIALLNHQRQQAKKALQRNYVA